MSKTSPKLINSTIWQHTLHLSEISFFVDFCHPYVVFCGQKNVTTLLMVFFSVDYTGSAIWLTWQMCCFSFKHGRYQWVVAYQWVMLFWIC